MPHFVPRWALLLGLLSLLSPGGLSRQEATALFGAPPMAGRPTSESMTLTLHGGARPVRVSLALTEAPRAGEAVPRSLVFEPVVARTDPEGWRVVAHWPGDAPASPSGHAPAVPPTSTDAATLRDWIELPAHAYLEIVATGLRESTEYTWHVRGEELDPGSRRGAAVRSEESEGRVVTMRPRGEAFRFALVSDMHFFVGGLEPPIPEQAELHEGYLYYSLQSVQWLRETKARIEAEFRRVARNVVQDRPDFVVGLGDHFDLHTIDFNAAFVDQTMADTAHREAREHLAQGLNAAGPMFQVLGNWEGESGDHAPEDRALAIDARRRFQINPRADTPGYQAGPNEDYYAFAWGDVQFVALNVRGYTPTSHLLGGEGANAGDADDFTLGSEQRRFLEQALESSDRPYKVILIHHAVGGRAGDEANSAYGRGGGQAAHVGEQEWVHALMRRCGVQVFFYGHDHVFTDLVVDGIHYTLAGTTGAPWRFTTAETGYEKYWPDAGHVRVDVDPRRMHVELVDFRGQVLYSYEVEPRR